MFAENHQQVFHNKKKLEDIWASSNYNDCPFCPETYKTKEILMEHLFNDHGYQKEYIQDANTFVLSTNENPNLMYSMPSDQNNSNLTFNSKDDGKFGQ